MYLPEGGGSRHRLAALLLALAFCAGVGALAPAFASAPEDPAGGALRRAEVVDALAQERADPEFQDTEKTHVLRWKNQRKQDAKPDPSYLAFLHWLREASRWVARAGRWFLWLVGAAVVAVVAVSLRYWIRERADAIGTQAALLPQRVGALDVRPESLPDDIGAAARELWIGGEGRNALSLLYRGALSRLIHRHAVGIRAAHTESECLRLARARLGADAGEYFSRLVATWQRAVYGAQEPESEGVFRLCEDFDSRLGRAQGAGSAS
jgi:hypothetical protein